MSRPKDFCADAPIWPQSRESYCAGLESPTSPSDDGALPTCRAPERCRSDVDGLATVVFQRHSLDFPIKPTAFVGRQIPRRCVPLRQGVARRGANRAPFRFRTEMELATNSGGDRVAVGFDSPSSVADRPAHGDTLEASLRSAKLARGRAGASAVDLAHFANHARTSGPMNGFGCGSGGHRKWRQTISLPATTRWNVIEPGSAIAAARRPNHRVGDGAPRSGRARSR